jgi:alkanesulfonate monooxygenase SsuD/methylene tetrahydromethanopterin reductase-like flavin-dependent oxidoreductase (luciferase family)
LTSADYFDRFVGASRALFDRDPESGKIVRLRTGERFSFSGKHFQLNDALITPRPMRPAGPPIWMASWTPHGLRRAGRLAECNTFTTY